MYNMCSGQLQNAKAVLLHEPAEWVVALAMRSQWGFECTELCSQAGTPSTPRDRRPWPAEGLS